MRRTRSALLAFVIPMILMLAASAQAQNGSSVAILFGAPGKILSTSSGQVRAQGQIVVSFHGDSGTGCAAAGLCPYSGTIVVRAGSGGFGVVTYRLRGRTRREASLFLNAGPGQYSTAASVERSIPGQPPGMCADTESNSFGSPSATVHNGTVTIGLFAAHGNVLSTRCAGPLDGDLAGAGPTVTIPLKRFARGRTTLNLSGTRSFASHGFAGTVDSTLVLVLGKPSNQSTTQPRFPPGIKTTRIRTVTERLTLIRESGDLTGMVQGAANPLICRLLDSCRLTGTIGFGQSGHEFNGSVVASGPAARPQRDFLAALGLSAGNPRGISVVVVGNWSQGPATANLTQSGPCTDSAPGAIMFVTLARARSGLTGFASAASWHTRCPGPILSAQSNPLLDAAVAPSVLGHRTFTIGLRPAGPVEDDGYTLTVQGHLSLVVRRGRITQQVATQPAG